MSYYKPTPVKWRKIGDAILLGSASLSTLMMASPLDDNHQKWAMWGLGIFGVVGKVITNFFKETDTNVDGSDAKV